MNLGFSVGDTKRLTIEHIPVLSEQLVERISLHRDAVVVDATVGHGGHSLLFGKMLGPEGIVVGLDFDEKCLTRAQMNLSSLESRVILLCENFADIGSVLHKQGIEKADLIIADLGFCSAQVLDRERGLSFQQDQVLDMRLSGFARTTAAEIVNDWDQQVLADIFYRFGQERGSRKIARYIVEYRKNKRITTTGELAGIICSALRMPARARSSRIHPATRSFQALRIVVNDELNNLERFLAGVSGLLRPSGLLAVISFHSLEDGLVKRDFKRNSSEGIYEILTKKPITATRDQIAKNPRSRSAKLRIAKRL